eukprot:CAMPEP_0170493506 /NCGR_PEP_ID=MMETSP0208-20121228/14013_1 /TAXON_ID=197538 /ORGANISM="Strombidium inclinatum, Strain S3" /LENGTH=176 /DNA_ID=CAMNT_0010769441 /DNA_START=480 /DNA_END=1010 /DNA_ORIENTATION=-
MDVDPMPIGLVVLPLTFEFVTVGMVQNSVAISLIVLPLADVARAIGPVLSTSSMAATVLPATSIDSSAREGDRPTLILVDVLLRNLGSNTPLRTLSEDVLGSLIYFAHSVLAVAQVVVAAAQRRTLSVIDCVHRMEHLAQLSDLRRNNAFHGLRLEGQLLRRRVYLVGNSSWNLII